MLSDSVGVSSPPVEPLHCTDSMKHSSKSYLRYSTLVPPDFRKTTWTLPKWLPSQQARNSAVEAESVFFMTLKLEIDTLPPPLPSVPEPMVTGFDAPSENE